MPRSHPSLQLEIIPLTRTICRISPVPTKNNKKRSRQGRKKKALPYLDLSYTPRFTHSQTSSQSTARWWRARVQKGHPPCHHPIASFDIPLPFSGLGQTAFELLVKHTRPSARHQAIYYSVLCCTRLRYSPFPYYLVGTTGFVPGLFLYYLPAYLFASHLHVPGSWCLAV
jgi:hypothetical protein